LSLDAAKAVRPSILEIGYVMRLNKIKGAWEEKIKTYFGRCGGGRVSLI
jgi:hypothetical protein